MNALWQDLRYGVRMLVQKPGFTLIAALTLALGIGATTAIFSVVNAVVLRPLPYPNPDRLAMVWMNNKRINVAEDWHSWPNYVDYRDQNKVFESIAAFNNTSFNLIGEGDPVRVVGAWGTANLFPTLGVNPILGRGFTVEDTTQTLSGKGKTRSQRTVILPWGTESVRSQQMNKKGGFTFMMHSGDFGLDLRGSHGTSDTLKLYRSKVHLGYGSLAVDPDTITATASASVTP